MHSSEFESIEPLRYPSDQLPRESKKKKATTIYDKSADAEIRKRDLNKAALVIQKLCRGHLTRKLLKR